MLSWIPDLRGYVDRPTVIVGEGKRSREFIASNDAVENPTVAPVLSIINSAQQAGRIRSLNLKKSLRLAGFQSGGFISLLPGQMCRETREMNALEISSQNLSQLLIAYTTKSSRQKFLSAT